ncbi:MAG: ribbon-helix-helix domain-containing protein, partial [Alphaproteobacteria bacterium]|nr:ribbon-helix-helix domain-containing protein [Alphaproteobacteria bacterium]
MSSRLVNRNVTVSGHRTSMRLEPELWEALTEIARREERTVNEICTEVDRRRGESTLTSAIRVFIVTYFRSLAPRPDKSPTPGSSRARSPRARNQAAR